MIRPFLIAGTLSLAAATVVSADSTTIIAVTDVPPAGSGRPTALFRTDAYLNDAGQVGFHFFLDTVFRGDGASLITVADTPSVAPGGNGFLTDVQSHGLNNTGQVVVAGLLSGTSGGANDDSAIYLGDGSNLVQIAREGQLLASGNRLSSVISRQLPLNDAGQVAFTGSYSLPDGGSRPFGSSVFRSDGSSLVEVARSGQAAPGGGVFTGFSNLSAPTALNERGQVLFEASLDLDGDGSAPSGNGLFRGDGASLVQVVRRGQDAPGGGTFVSFSTLRAAPTLNDAGISAFRGVINTEGEAPSVAGIFLGDDASLSQITRVGEAAPDRSGFVAGLEFPVALNNAGQVAFFADVADGSRSDTVLYRGDGSGLVPIAREGQPAPGGGTYSSLSTERLDINNAGQVVFFGTIGTRPAGGGFRTDRSLVLHDDDLGLLEVARTGKSMLGSTVINLRLALSSYQYDSASGLNARGQVAYNFELLNGRSGIALWTVPEPAAAAVGLGTAGLGLIRRRR